jgi:hypothetical protein
MKMTLAVDSLSGIQLGIRLLKNTPFYVDVNEVD